LNCAELVKSKEGQEVKDITRNTRRLKTSLEILCTASKHYGFNNTATICRSFKDVSLSPCREFIGVKEVIPGLDGRWSGVESCDIVKILSYFFPFKLGPLHGIMNDKLYLGDRILSW